MKEDPFESLANSIAGHSRDQSIDARDAWVYGIVLGWDAASLREIAALHGWNDLALARLKRLRAAFALAARRRRARRG